MRLLTLAVSLLTHSVYASVISVVNRVPEKLGLFNILFQFNLFRKHNRLGESNFCPAVRLSIQNEMLVGKTDRKKDK